MAHQRLISNSNKCKTISHKIINNNHNNKIVVINNNNNKITNLTPLIENYQSLRNIYLFIFININYFYIVH